MFAADVAALILFGPQPGPGAQNRVDQGGQRNGKENAPETPDAAKDKNRNDDGHRVQADHLGKQYGHQHVAVQGLDNGVGDEHIPESGADAEGRQRHQRHRQRGHGRANVGNEHRKPNHHGQQHDKGQLEQRKHDVGDYPDNQDFQHLAAHIVADLGIDLLPHARDQRPVARQILGKPGHEPVLVLEKEKHQNGYEHQKNKQADHAGHARQRYQRRAIADQLAADIVQKAGQLVLRNERQLLRRLLGHGFQIVQRGIRYSVDRKSVV